MLVQKLSFVLFSCLVLAQSHDGKLHAKRAISPDNTCGGINKYTCNPNDPQGGSCCSSSGFCGITAAYCGAGCQKTYGSCFGTSPPATQSGKLWVVAGVGSFTSAETFDFAGNIFPQGRLLKDGYPVPDPGAPFNHTYKPENVVVSGGYMQLKVPGGQTTSPLSSAQVSTTFTNIRYASVRTTAILGGPAGVCHGFFFYKSGTQELDIEYLSDPTSKSNPGDGSKPMHYTNQPAAPNSVQIAPSPSDATTAPHEYRIDWIPGKAMYYLDGVLQKTITVNVPSVGGTWLWNNWANGDPGWTGAPPKTDNVLKIGKIVMYYNTTAV